MKIQPLSQPISYLPVNSFRQIFLKRVGTIFSEIFMTERPPPKTYHSEFFRQQFFRRKIVKRGQKFPFRKVSARAEHHHDARRAWNNLAAISPGRGLRWHLGFLLAM